MLRIAHLSDVHLNGSTKRHHIFRSALAHAGWSGAQHLLLTGDLTNSGKPAQIEELAYALRDVDEDAVTIVPGNHDGSPEAWNRALNGPLHRFKRTSTIGAPIDLGEAVVLPLSTQYGRRAPLFWALGALDKNQVDVLDAITSQFRQKCTVVAMHHGPQLSLLQPFDGLNTRRQVKNALARGPHVHICCGHEHNSRDIGRVFVAPSVLESRDPLRVYDVNGTRLVPLRRR